ncbi:hypothetical protein [Leifsonia shinshuensis]|uniref:DUF4878 domain-containing protein n=1 Tax=Leifsonia shinshuensis TaxID=150026 RepID=A0A853CU75_9MICO|nr:hypothetical protein [Leifsonia shinshuensis]NYJ22744.1 hypothetical protein [Leifsonia shinshuensis]
MTTRVWIVIGAFASALCLGLAATVVVMFFGAREASQPSAIVSAYLSQVERGHISAALRMEGRAADPAEVLLTDTAYRHATDRMTGFDILGTRTVGAGATVEARIQQKSGSSTATFELSRTVTPLSPLGLDTWRLRPVELTTVEITVGAPGRIAATLAGVPLGWKGAVQHIHAFPGDYAFALTSQSPWFTVPDAAVSVAGFGHSDRFQVPATLTAKGRDAAIAAADAWLDQCAAVPDFHPVRCSFGLTSGPDAGEVWANQSWKVQSRPTLAIGDWDFGCRTPTTAGVSAGGCWPVTTTAPGEVTFHADYSIPATGETGDVTSTGPIEADVTGWISSFTDSGALFGSVDWTD